MRMNARREDKVKIENLEVEDVGVYLCRRDCDQKMVEAMKTSRNV